MWMRRMVLMDYSNRGFVCSVRHPSKRRRCAKNGQRCTGKVVSQAASAEAQQGDKGIGLMILSMWLNPECGRPFLSGCGRWSDHPPALLLGLSCVRMRQQWYLIAQSDTLEMTKIAPRRFSPRWVVLRRASRAHFG